MFFGWLKNCYRMAEAASTLEIVFKDVAQAYQVNLQKPDLIAREFIEKVWDTNKPLFSGKLGARPHKLTVCIYALAHAAEGTDVGGGLFRLIVQSVERFAADLQHNGFAYDFKPVDHSMQEKAFSVIQHKMQEFDALMTATGLDESYRHFSKRGI